MTKNVSLHLHLRTCALHPHKQYGDSNAMCRHAVIHLMARADTRACHVVFCCTADCNMHECAFSLYLWWHDHQHAVFQCVLPHTENHTSRATDPLGPQRCPPPSVGGWQGICWLSISRVSTGSRGRQQTPPAAAMAAGARTPQPETTTTHLCGEAFALVHVSFHMLHMLLWRQQLVWL
jgi:hypothetical protein